MFKQDAGFVADSIPEKEWEETMNKGKAIFKAVELAGKNLTEEKRELVAYA